MSWRKYMLLLLLSGVVFFACNKEDFEEVLQARLSKQISSQHYNYYMALRDDVDTVFQERYITWLLTELEVELTEKINYYRFHDRNHIENVTDRRVNGYAESEKNRLFSIWSTDSHESVHVVVGQQISLLPAFFNEGIAVAYSGFFEDSTFIAGWNGEDFHLLTKTFWQTGKLPTLTTFLKDFRSIDANTSYPISGSFVSYLIDN